MTAERSYQQNFENWKLDEQGIIDVERRHKISKN